MRSNHFPVLASVLLWTVACSAGPAIRAEIPSAAATPQPSVEAIMAAALADTFTYGKLGELCDTVGNRLTGSPGMKRAVAWAIRSLEEAGCDSVWTEPVTVPHWTRGSEWARCVSPLEFDLEMIGMGLSDGTGPEGIQAEILAVRDFDELEARADEAAGRIVLFNEPWEGYGKSVQYRVAGASRAARHGALAVLIRSVTGHSLGAPHTGMMHYDDDAPRIPIAALTVEDADRLFRMSRRGMKPVVKLYMEARNHDDGLSYNVVGEIRGREKPEEIVLVSGHLDSWDVGTCAMDDGVGVVLALGTGKLILQQDLRPRRTVRVVLFTCEEMGIYGGRAYLEAHRSELDRHVLALESDSGSFTPRGFTVDADSTTVALVADLAAPLARLAPDTWQVTKGGSGADVDPLVREGVPGVGHRVDTSSYFDFHHCRADTYEKIDPETLVRNLAAVAGLVFAAADHPASLGSHSR